MVPYNVSFCVYIACEHLVHRGLCSQEICVYNLKWIEHWVKYGHYPPEVVV